MPVTSIEARRRDRTAGDSSKRVVAVVLEDGTVRPLDESDKSKIDRWTGGQLSGPDWILWWERRSWPGVSDR
jgi:hypothetical protein